MTCDMPLCALHHMHLLRATPTFQAICREMARRTPKFFPNGSLQIADSHRRYSMQLREHPSLMGRWPPRSGGLAPTPRAGPADCLDILVEANVLEKPQLGISGIILATTVKDEHFVREIVLFDRLFARALCKYLNHHAGKTIQDIGRLDVTFEAVSYATREFSVH